MSTNELYEQRNSFYFNLGTTARGGIVFCILMGLITFMIGLFSGDPVRAWGSFLFNLFFFFCISLGGIAFSAMQDVIGAKWGRPIMRLHEAFASFLPVSLVAFTIFFICIFFKIGSAEQVYRWIADPSMLDHFWGKNIWLRPESMLIRNFFALVVTVLIAMWQMKLKLTRDMMFIRGDQAGAKQIGEKAQARLRYWSGPILVVYALTFSLLAFDLTMSLSPLWFSTLWGGWYFSIMMQTLLATLLLAMYILRGSSLERYIGRQQFHDVGKLMHGFTIFFAYLTYAHVLTYWYGNVPEETEYFIHRLHGPWFWIIVAVPILAFVFPLFALLPKASKWTAALAIPISAVILFAQWLTDLVVVMPEVTDGAKWHFPWMEVGCFLGFLGLFIASIFWFGKRFPMISVADPLLHEALEEGHH